MSSNGRPPGIAYRPLAVAPGDAPEQQPHQLQLLTKIVQQLAAQVETLSVATAPTKHTTSAIPTADSDKAAGGRLELDALPADSTNTPLAVYRRPVLYHLPH
jgi:hypothetical protein